MDKGPDKDLFLQCSYFLLISRFTEMFWHTPKYFFEMVEPSKETVEPAKRTQCSRRTRFLTLYTRNLTKMLHTIQNYYFFARHFKRTNPFMLVSSGLQYVNNMTISPYYIRMLVYNRAAKQRMNPKIFRSNSELLSLCSPVRGTI